MKTKKDEWIEVKLPLDKFEAPSFGRVVKDAGPVDTAEVNALGFLLGDKKAGPFKLEIEWIKVVKTGSAKESALSSACESWPDCHDWRRQLDGYLLLRRAPQRDEDASISLLSLELGGPQSGVFAPDVDANLQLSVL